MAQEAEVRVYYFIPGIKYLHQTICSKEELDRVLAELAEEGCRVQAVEFV